MHTFLPERRVVFAGRPRQRLSPPTYWFIRGDLEPPCHMLPQMGTSLRQYKLSDSRPGPQWMPKEREKELCQPPRQHKLCACVVTYAHMWIIRLLYVHAWSCVILCVHVPPTTYMCWCMPCGQRMSAPVNSLNAMMFARSEQGERCQIVDAGRWGREERCDQPTSDR